MQRVLDRRLLERDPVAQRRARSRPSRSAALRARPSFAASGDAERFGHQRAAREVEVRAHAILVHLEAGEELTHVADRAGGVAEELRQRDPLGLPRADGALVLLARRTISVGTSAMARRAAASADIASTGLRFCGMADEPPLPGFAPSDSSPTSVCARSATSLGDLAHRAGGDAERRGDSRDAIALGVPGQIGLGQRRAPRRAIAATAGPASPSEASVPTAPPNCSGSAVADAERVERAQLAHGEREPARRLEAEGDRRRLLQERPAGHHRVAVPLGERRGALGDAVQLAHEQVEAVAHLEHQRGVDDVLARRAPVHVAARLAHRRAR